MEKDTRSIKIVINLIESARALLCYGLKSYILEKFDRIEIGR